MRQACITAEQNAATAVDAGTGAGSDTNSDLDDAIGSQVGDNPTQLNLGGKLLYAGGTVVGNLLFVGAASLLIGCGKAAYVVAVHRRAEGTWAVDGGVEPHIRRSALHAAIPLYLIILQPSVAASVLLIAANRTPIAVVVGLFGAAYTMLPVVGLCVYLLRDFPLVARPRPYRAPRIAALRVVQPNWKWIAGFRGAEDPHTRRVLHFFLPLIEPYGRGFHWMFAFEMGGAIAQGILVGRSLVSTSCAAADVYLWVLFGITCVTFLVLVVLRPFATHFDNAQSCTMNAWSGAIILLAVAQRDEAATLLTLVQMIVALVALGVPSAICVLRWLGTLDLKNLVTKSVSALNVRPDHFSFLWITSTFLAEHVRLSRWADGQCYGPVDHINAADAALLSSTEMRQRALQEIILFICDARSMNVGDA
jgi:hypothetical protein